MLAKIKIFLLDILFPIECLGCGKESEWICQKCFNSIDVEKTFKQLDLEKNCLDSFFYAMSYEQKLVQEIIHKYKYNFIKDLGDPLSKLMIVYLQEHNLNFNNIDFLLPVPLHKKREFYRGFNQSRILAEKIGEFLNKPVLPENILVRKVNRVSQVKIQDRASRIENVKGIFALADVFFSGKDEKINYEETFPLCKRGIKGDFLKNKNILLIDDIATTGATLSECARVLKSAGAGKIVGLVAAKN